MEAYNLLNEPYCRNGYFNSVFQELDKYEWDYSFVLTHYRNKTLPTTRKSPIVLCLGDESHASNTQLLQDYSPLIFKNYAPLQPTKGIIPLPLGYNNGFQRKPGLKISERPMTIYLWHMTHCVTIPKFTTQCVVITRGIPTAI